MNTPINSLLNLEETIAKDVFSDIQYPWEVLARIHDFILTLGASLNKSEYLLMGENVWVHKDAQIFKTSFINGPAIICKDAQVRHCAFIRGNVIVGEGAVVGNSTEVKNSILFNKVQVPHYNYVGDSILGYKSHMGAGAITSNVKSDKSMVSVLYNGEKFNTSLKKFGAVIADNVEIGCNSVLNPGVIIGRNSIVYPLSMVRGAVGENTIYKNKNEVVPRV